MRIGIVSDTHLGFGMDSEREEDSFRNCREALEKVSDTDVVIMPGDIFDTKIPSQEVLSRTIKLFRTLKDGSEVEFEGKVWKDGRKPVVAIHGTHERRGRDSVNPVELLDDAGFLVHLHNEKVTVRKDGERVNIFGMSGVPERYAPKVLKRWDPEPEEGYNILMFHQSVEGFVYTDSETDVLKLSDMPEGFDLLIDGHIHWRNLELRGKDVPLIFPGSTIATQLNKKEMETRKGVVIIDTEKDELSFRPLEGTRKVHRLEVDVTGMGENEIVDLVVKEVEDILEEHEKDPLVRVAVTGETESSIRSSEIRRRIEGCILKIGDKTSSPENDSEQVEMGEDDVEEVGVSILSDQLGFEGFEDVFSSLADGDVEEVLEMFREMDREDLEEFLEQAEEGENRDEKSGKDCESDPEKEKTGGNSLLDYV